MTNLFANSGDPDQTPRSAASELGLQCLPITILLVSRLQWVNMSTNEFWIRFFAVCESSAKTESTGKQQMLSSVCHGNTCYELTVHFFLFLS